MASLGRGLRETGHEVRLATHVPLRDLAEREGLEFFALPGDPRRVFENPAWTRRRRFGLNPIARIRLDHEVGLPLFGQIQPEHCEAAAAGADAVVFTLGTPNGHYVAQKLGLASVLASYIPLLRTRSFPHPIAAPGLRGGGLANLLSYPYGERVTRQPFREPVRPAARAGLGLSPIPLTHGRENPWPKFPIVHGFPRALVPPPADWPVHVHVTGPWLPEPAPGRVLPERLEAFLTDGRAPVYIGFGSMRARDPRRLTAAVLKGLAMSGERAVLGAGWGALAGVESTRDVLVIEDAPFDLLFPRVKAVVHHGGIGTTSLGLRAGRPTWIVPFVFDQWFWGMRVARLGAGPPPLAHTKLTSAALVRGLRQLNAPESEAGAARLAAAMVDEDGPRNAATAIGEFLELAGRTE